MAEEFYMATDTHVREDLRKSHALAWKQLQSPGSWWSGEQRLAIAAEARNAASCPFCRERKEQLSPNAISGEHLSLGDVPPGTMDVIHRVCTDPGRLSEDWFRQLMESGLGEGPFVELIGIISVVTGLDYFARGLGLPAFPLPSPLPGEASGIRPSGASPDSGWLPMIAPEDATGPEADLYGETGSIPDVVPNIVRALSIVPNEARLIQELMASHYLPLASLNDMSFERSLSRVQIELVASRVSSYNDCFY